MPTNYDLAQAIATQEGYFKSGTLAQRNNNPGNLRAGPRAIAKDGNGLAVYASVNDGWLDLYRQIGLDAGRGLTLAQFIAKYAPPSENNTGAYLANVSGWIGMDPGTKLATLDTSGANFPQAPRPGRQIGRAATNRRPISV